jgi:uncharacterized protein YwbE
MILFQGKMKGDQKTTKGAQGVVKTITKIGEEQGR